MKRVIVAVAIFIILAAGTALAATPEGQWTFKAFSGPDHTPGPRHGICFLADGTWFSTTFSGWSGQWIQDGGRIKFYGTTGILSTAEFGHFTSDTRFTGQFVHFFPTPPVATSSSGTFNVVWTSSICDLIAASPDYSGDSVANGDPAIK